MVKTVVGGDSVVLIECESFLCLIPLLLKSL
mgnify:CR=1 FL=1|jgi:hypothetical protein